jgi:hypothetical protein
MALTGSPEVPDETVGLTMTMSARSILVGWCSSHVRQCRVCPLPAPVGERAINGKTFGTRSVPSTLGDDELEPFSIEGSYS